MTEAEIRQKVNEANNKIYAVAGKKVSKIDSGAAETLRANWDTASGEANVNALNREIDGINNMVNDINSQIQKISGEKLSVSFNETRELVRIDEI